MTTEQKTLKYYDRVCYTTEEFTELIEAVKAQGGQVLGTFALRGGSGINVRYCLLCG